MMIIRNQFTEKINKAESISKEIEMRYIEITESPIGDLEFIDNRDDTQKKTDTGSFRDSDWKISSNEKWIKKLHNFFSKVPYTFNLYFLNSDYNYRNLVHHMGYIPVSDMKNNKEIPFEIFKNYTNGINVIFTNNEGSERFALTPWIAAHRTVHALFEKDIESFKILTSLFHSLINSGYRSLLIDDRLAKLVNFKSAKLKKLTNNQEFIVELFTNYLLTGDVKFNRPELSQTVKSMIESPYYELFKNTGNKEDFIKQFMIKNDMLTKPTDENDIIKYEELETDAKIMYRKFLNIDTYSEEYNDYKQYPILEKSFKDTFDRILKNAVGNFYIL